MSIQASTQENPGTLYGVKRTPANTTLIRVPVSTRQHVPAPATETPPVRYPKDLTEYLTFALNPGADWR